MPQTELRRVQIRVGGSPDWTRGIRRARGVLGTPRIPGVVRLTLAMFLWTHSASGDAIMRTQAMSATTIAEYFIERDHIRLELEIGLDDLEGFGNLVPDPIYERLGHEQRPHGTRRSKRRVHA